MAAWVLGVVKGAMEWATVPVLALAMALPHGALVYWLSSSLCSLAQVRFRKRPPPTVSSGRGKNNERCSEAAIPLHRFRPHGMRCLQTAALQSPAARRLLALPGAGAQPGSAAPSAKRGADGMTPTHEVDVTSLTDVPQLFVKVLWCLPHVQGWCASLRAAGTGSRSSCRQTCPTLASGDPALVLVPKQAAELRAAGEPERALAHIERIMRLQPGNGRALFAAGQLHATLQRWPAAAQAYSSAAVLEQGEPAQQARCWFGAGALHLLGVRVKIP